MNENTNLWNKKINDLTVADTAVLSIVTPIVMMGGCMLVGAVVGGVSSVVRKVRTRKPVTVTPPPEGE